MASVHQIGRLVFAIPAGMWADKYGVKLIIITVGCIHVITWAMLSVTHSVWLILAIRLVVCQKDSESSTSNAGKLFISDLYKVI